MIRLGYRLATSAGRASAIGIGLTAFAVALGTAILLFALSVSPALDDRYMRSAWRVAPRAAADGEPAPGLLLEQTIEVRFRDEPLVMVYVAGLSPDAPPAPGIARLPEPGEAFVSPALLQRIQSVPTDQLYERIGSVVGSIGDEALRSPQELVAIVGMEPAALRAQGATGIASFRTVPRLPELPPIMVLMLILAVAGAMAPVAVFVGTATRLSAARREQRLAALRLVGATPLQVRQLAIVEALIPTLTGTVAGVALFFVTRPLIALVPLDQATWFPESIAPPLLPAMALLAMVPVVGAVAAVVSLRRVVVTPLGVQRRQTPPRPTALRLVPLIIAVVLLIGTLATLRSRSTETLFGITLVGGSFAGIIGGMALAGPWLTSLVGRGLFRLRGGATTLLASRRLTDDPRSSFGAIAGVVMAVFVASAFFTFIGYSRAQAHVPTTGPAGVVEVTLPQSGGPTADGLVARLEAAGGVHAVLPVGVAEMFDEHGQPMWMAWVVPCSRFAAITGAPISSCDEHPIHRMPSTFLPPGTYRLIAEHEAGGTRPSFEVVILARDVAELPPEMEEGSSFGLRPNLIIEPTAFDGIAATIPVSTLTLWTDGTAETIDRVRTAVGRDFPTAYLNVFDAPRASQPIFEEFGRIVHVGLIGSLILAGCSLAVAVTTGILERRREFALLRSAGMPVSRLRSLVMLQAGAPLVAVALFSSLLGIVVAQVVLSLAGAPEVPLPDASLALTLGASVASALGVVALTLPWLERLTRPDAVRME